MKVYKVIDKLQKLAKDNPEQEITIETGKHHYYECPCCGKNVIERQKGFFCENRECKFALWKDNRFMDSLSKKMNKSVAENLLKDRKVKLKKCRSIKTGKTYDTTLVMKVDEKQRPQFSLDFENRSQRKDR